MRGWIRGIAVLSVMVPQLAFAAGAGAPSYDATAMSLAWVLPFVGILLSIALFPLLAPQFWHHHFGKVSLFWALSFIVPFLITNGVQVAIYELLHVGLLDYVPFIILLFALFTVAGGIHLTGSIRGRPTTNTAFLAIGTAVASVMGTTGASVLLIRPVVRANRERKHKVHVVVFFIFLVSNIGGALTPLGDPPLFLGFLKGVDFFWPTIHLLPETLTAAVILLVVFYLMDSYYYRQEAIEAPPVKEPIGIQGKANIVLLVAVMGAVLLSGVWKTGISFEIYHVQIELQSIVRDVLLLAIAFLSIRMTAAEHREANAFSWGPILEVAKLFGGIFVTIIPAIAILRSGTAGALAPVVNAVSDNGQPLDYMYFWLTGALSSFLDNAPTYLIFFNTAGGDAEVLMTKYASTLAAISAGAVFMGANSYIGNAPNFMVRSIAEEWGVKMPSFFGYMAWSGAILIPLFILLTFLFYR